MKKDYFQFSNPAYLRTVLLERRVFANRKTIDEFFALENIEVRTEMAAHMMGQMAVELRAYVYGREMDTVKIHGPINWWQHFKRDCFPKWLLKRFPAKENSKTVSVQEYYPMVSMPEKEHVVRFVVSQP